MAVKHYYPTIQVILFQVSSGDKQIEITGWFGYDDTIRIHKSIREPSGRMDFTFREKPVNAGTDAESDSIYAYIAPQDVIEVRAAHDSATMIGGAAPLLMRGFVDSVEREMSIDPSGKPSRTVTISCRDIGKLLETQWVHFTTSEAMKELSGYGHLLEWFGTSANPMPLATFISLWQDVLNYYFSAMTKARPALSNLTIDNQVTAEGSIPRLMVASIHDVSFYQFVTRLIDAGVFNEFFMRDTDGGSTLICRPNFDVGSDEDIQISDTEITSMRMRRSDEGVANWYWVSIPEAQLMNQNDVAWQAMTVGGDRIDMRTNEQCKESVFGWRPMQVEGHLFPPDYGNASAPKQDDVVSDTALLNTWLQARVDQLKTNNIDNVNLESGHITLRGNEAVLPGYWLSVTRGYQNPAANSQTQVVERMYAVSVDHAITFGGAWTTSVSVERGTGYKNRTQASGDASAGSWYATETPFGGVYG